jgi:hypothetical protein
MHPISFVKAHPLATVTLMGLGMAVGPWILGFVNNKTGVSIGIPTVGGS